MRWIIGISLKFRTIVVSLASVIMLLGSLQLSGASIDVFPESRLHVSKFRLPAWV